MDNPGFEMDEMRGERGQENTSHQVDQDYADLEASGGGDDGLEAQLLPDNENDGQVVNMLENAPNPPVVEPGLGPAELSQKMDEITLDEKTKKLVLSFLVEIENHEGYTAKITEENMKKFHIGPDEKLYVLYNNKLIQITRTNIDHKGGREFYKLSGLASQGGTGFVTDFLGIKDYNNPKAKTLKKLLVTVDQVDKIDQNPSRENKEDQTDEVDKLLNKIQEIAEQYSNLNPEDEASDQPQEIAQQSSNLNPEDEASDQPHEIAQQSSELNPEDEASDQPQEIAQQSSDLNPEKTFDPEGDLSKYEPREILGYIKRIKLTRGQLQLVEARIVRVKRNIQITEDALKEPDITQDQKKRRA